MNILLILSRRREQNTIRMGDSRQKERGHFTRRTTSYALSE